LKAVRHLKTTLGMVRIAVFCRRCGGHQAVFDDGPKPTGLRYCMNGVAMTFKRDVLNSNSEYWCLSFRF
jgi:peptide methionine sulfoxide reductase MsrB